MKWKEFTGVQGVGGVYRSPESGRSVKFQGVGGVTGARGVGGVTGARGVGVYST
jgi:hypothetical protein